MQADSAPATRCSISVRQGGKRVALMELDPSTTLRECLQQLPSDVEAPALVDPEVLEICYEVAAE